MEVATVKKPKFLIQDLFFASGKTLDRSEKGFRVVGKLKKPSFEVKMLENKRKTPVESVSQPNVIESKPFIYKQQEREKVEPVFVKRKK